VTVNPDEVAGMEFPVVMRGYAREEVQAFLAGLADEMVARDERLSRLEAEVERLQQPRTPTRPTAGDRQVLLRQLGEEAASILACADASAERIKARAVTTTEKVRHDLESIGTSLGDVHQLLGELVSLVQGLTDGPAFGGIDEVDLADGAASTAGPEVRTVLGEVLGLDAESGDADIRVADESSVSGG
jgi:DivIVA domain-containing protein